MSKLTSSAAHSAAVMKYHRRNKQTARQIDRLDRELLLADPVDYEDWDSLPSYEINQLVKLRREALDHGF